MFGKLFFKSIAVVMVSIFASYTNVYGYSFTESQATDLQLNPYSYQTQLDPYSYQDPTQMGTTTEGQDQASFSEATQLTSLNIAPGPVVITTSSGDVYLYERGQMRMRMSTNQQGTESMTFYANNAPAYEKDEFGRVTFYNYANFGQNVTLTNQAGAIVATQLYQDGQMLWSQGESGTITYNYDENNQLIGAVDPFGNTTNYDGGRPANITNSDGEIVGSYKYVGDVLSTYSDQFGNVTHFDKDGKRPEYATNAQGTVTQVYKYDTLGNLQYIINKLTGQTTNVDQGFNTTTTNQEGAVVSANIYDDRGYTTFITSFADDGSMSGWTVMDEWGRAWLTYNAQGSLVQENVYNGYGSLDHTNNYGRIDPLTNQPTLTSTTTFDEFGRASEVKNTSGAVSQNYVYNTNGVLSRTENRGRNGVLGGWTTFDEFGRSQYSFNNVGDIVQEYFYSNGFLDFTTSLGEDGIVTGKTFYDAFQRPNVVFNERGEVGSGIGMTQIYTYGSDGFLEQTVAYGENNTITGYTNYDAQGRATDVYNIFSDTPVQQYVYDNLGFLLMTKTYGNVSANDQWVLTDGERNLLHSLETTGTYNFGNYSSQTLVSKAWTALGQFKAGTGAFDEVVAYAMKTIEMYRNNALDQEAAWLSTHPNGELPTKAEMEADNMENFWALNDVGTAYFILGEAFQSNTLIENNFEMAAIAYKIVAVDLTMSQCWDPAGPWYWSVAAGAADKDHLTALGIKNPVYTGYTNYDDFSRPTEAWQLSSTGVEMLTQTFDYSKRDEAGNIVKTDAGFLQRTNSWGGKDPSAAGDTVHNGQVSTGYTTYDQYNRQDASFNEHDAKVQDYIYSSQGFLKYTNSIGRDGVVSSTTVYDDWSRQKKTYNTGGDLVSDNGVVQEYDYSVNGIDTGFLQKTISFGEDHTQTGYTTYDVYGRPDFAYNNWGYKVQEFDYTYKDAASGKMINDGILHRNISLAKNGTKISATYNDAWGRQQYAVQASEDIPLDPVDDPTSIYYGRTPAKVQNFIYDVNGFLAITESLDREGNKISETEYDALGRQLATYNIIDTPITDADGNIIADVGDRGARTQEYIYSAQGFLKETWSMGREGGRTGKTTFNKLGQQDKSYNESADEVTGKGLVQSYEYDEGFLVLTRSYGESVPVETTDNDGNVILIYHDLTNDSYIKDVTSYSVYDDFQRPREVYNVFGDFAMDAAGNIITNGEKVQRYNYVGPYDNKLKGKTENIVTGFLSTTINYDADGNDNGYTTYDGAGKARESFNAENSLVQKSVYANGFLTNTDSYGRAGTYTSKTVYDGAGKQINSQNEFGKIVQVFQYSDQGFLKSTLSMGNNGVFTGRTDLDRFGRQAKSYNELNDLSSDKGLVQTFDYTRPDGKQSGFMRSSTSYGTDQVKTGTTTYDAKSKQIDSKNAEGVSVQNYLYGADGFLSATRSLNQSGGIESTTNYDNYGRPSTVVNFADELIQSNVYIDGFLKNTISYGAGGLLNVTGWTAFDNAGRQDASYNYDGGVTQTFSYNDQGFLYRTDSFGLGGVSTGFTIYDDYIRQIKSYNRNGSDITGDGLVQQYVYDNKGFVIKTIAFGTDRTVTSETYFDEHGRPDKVYNTEGTLVTEYIYDGNNQYILPADWIRFSSSDPLITGGYTGEQSAQWEFKVIDVGGNADGRGKIGEGTVKIGVFDKVTGAAIKDIDGNDIVLDFGAGYDPAMPLDVGYGIKLSMAEGEVAMDNSFTLNLTVNKRSDTFNSITQLSGWSLMKVATPEFLGIYTAQIDDVWTFSINQDGIIGETQDLQITLMKQSGGMPIVRDIGAAAPANTRVDLDDDGIADVIRIDLGSGIQLQFEIGSSVLQNASFTTSLDKTGITIKSGWSTTPVVTPSFNLSGFTGTVDEAWTFRANMDGTIGQTAGLTIDVIKAGAVIASLDVGNNYAVGSEIVLPEGVKVAFSSGNVLQSDTFAVTLDYTQSTQITASEGWPQNSTATITITGRYDVAVPLLYTGVINKDGDIGVTDGLKLTLTGKDLNGNVVDTKELNIGSGYIPGDGLVIFQDPSDPSKNVVIALESGNVHANDDFVYDLIRLAEPVIIAPAGITATGNYGGAEETVWTFTVSAGKVTVKDNNNNVIGIFENSMFTAGPVYIADGVSVQCDPNVINGKQMTLLPREAAAQVEWRTNSTALFNITQLGAGYTGTSDVQLTFRVSNGGYIGIGNTQIQVLNQSGTVIATLDVGANYGIRSMLDIGTTGLQVSFTEGRVVTERYFNANLDVTPATSLENAGWQQALVPQINLIGEYTGNGNGLGMDDWIFAINQDGVIGQTSGLELRVTDNIGATIATLNIGAGYTPGSLLAIADGVSISLGQGIVAATNQFSAHLAYTMQLNTTELSKVPVPSEVSLGGDYSGPDDTRWEFRINQDGTVGTTSGLQLTVVQVNKDTGAIVRTVKTVDIGSGYTAGTAIAIEDGVTITLTEGMVRGNDAFMADLNIWTTDSKEITVNADMLLWSTNTTSVFNVVGDYTGTPGDKWTFKVKGSGAVGKGNLKIDVYENGALFKTLDVGAGYNQIINNDIGDNVTLASHEGILLEVADGISISLTNGTLNNGDSFSLTFGNNAGRDDGFMDKTINYGYDHLGDNDPDTGASIQISYTYYNAKGQAIDTYNAQNQLTQLNVYTRDGYLQKSLNYARNRTYMGMTTFDQWGRQVESFNEFGTLNQHYNYNAQGFMTESLSFGLDGAYTGKTVYNNLGRPDAAYNSERDQDGNGVIVQRFEYNDKGFLNATYSLQGQVKVQGIGMVDVVTSKTTYDKFGRPDKVYQVYQFGDVEGLSIDVNNDGKDDGYGFNPQSGKWVVSGQPVQLYMYGQYAIDANGNTVPQGADDGFLGATVSLFTNSSDPNRRGFNTITMFDKYGRSEISYQLKIGWGGDADEPKPYDPNAPLIGQLQLNDADKNTAGFQQQIVQRFYYVNGLLYATESLITMELNEQGNVVVKTSSGSVTYYNNIGQQIVSYSNSGDTKLAVNGVLQKTQEEAAGSGVKKDADFEYSLGFLKIQNSYSSEDENAISSRVIFDRAGRQAVMEQKQGGDNVYFYSVYGGLMAQKTNQKVGENGGYVETQLTKWWPGGISFWVN